jgi:hypothetical protein
MNHFSLSCYFYRETVGKSVAIEGEARRSLIEVAAEDAGISPEAGPEQVFAATQKEAVSEDADPVGEVSPEEWAITERFVAAMAKNIEAGKAVAIFVGDKMKLSEVTF